MSLLLPLIFKTLARIDQKQSSYIEQAVHEAIHRQSNLIITISCDEIKANVDCLDSIWEKIQAFLGTIYVIQLNTAYKLGKPLFDCNVVFQDICGYQVALEPYIKTICILPSTQQDNGNIIFCHEFLFYFLGS
jgi:pantetheine-phosphate adenylyltransferase